MGGTLGQAPNRWKVCAHAHEATASAAREMRSIFEEGGEGEVGGEGSFFGKNGREGSEGKSKAEAVLLTSGRRDFSYSALALPVFPSLQERVAKRLYESLGKASTT